MKDEMEEPVTTNKHAIASVVLAVLAAVIWGIGWTRTPIIYMMNVINSCLVPSLFLSSIIVGIIALNKLRKSNGRQKGNVLAVIGLLLGLLVMGHFCINMFIVLVCSILECTGKYGPLSLFIKRIPIILLVRDGN
jgi:hypothetical protein